LVFWETLYFGVHHALLSVEKSNVSAVERWILQAW
jgi:hypothetical protein